MNEPEHRRRLFFACDPGRVVRGRILAARPLHQGRTVDADNLHLTLAFLGSVPEGRLGELYAMAETIQLNSFRLNLDRLGHWRQGGILWMAPSKTPQPLSDLAAGLARGLADLGFDPEQRRYKPHITLARRVRGFSAGGAIAPVHWWVSGFHLMESVPVGTGVRYRRLKRWPLLRKPADQ